MTSIQKSIKSCFLQLVIAGCTPGPSCSKGVSAFQWENLYPVNNTILVSLTLYAG